MDYSTLSNDPDNPAGTSPWQSSPQPGAPPSPPMPKRSSYADTTERHTEEENSDQDNTSEERYQHQHQHQHQQGNQISQSENGVSSDSDQRYGQNPYQSRQQVYQQQSHQQDQQQQKQQQRGGAPNRYRGTARPVQRQNLPQYKLQAKITALERTGRKDPVLRFDVHVRFRISSCNIARVLMCVLEDQPSKISNHPIQRCPSYPLRVRQTGRPFDIVKSRSICPGDAPTVDFSWSWNKRG